MKKLRLLVIDDSTLFRKIVRDVAAELPGVEIVGVAPDGKFGLEKIRQLSPDLCTLDVQMPIMDGLQLLEEIRRQNLNVGVIMLSSLTSRGAKETMHALNLGAFDFCVKPASANIDESLDYLRANLLPKIQAYHEKLNRGASTSRVDSQPVRPAVLTPSSFPKSTMKPMVLAVGVSTGGPAALSKFLPVLPSTFPLPIVIVQHMPPLFTKSLADDLARTCSLQVVEASDGLPVMRGKVYIAPGGKQMRVTGSQVAARIQITDDPAEKSCKPSVDYLFRSVASVYGAASIGLIMTGMGDDGLLGCRSLKERGATTIAQDESTCTVYGMSRQIVDNGLADAVLPLHELADYISNLARPGVLQCK